MSQILIIYASDYGNTEKMAQAASEGVQSVEGGTSVVKNAEEVSGDDFINADGVIIGTPVHMGSMDWRIKKMIDTVCSGLWMQDKAHGRAAGVFASGSGYGNGGGGVELTFLSLLNNCAELGMIIVPLPKSTENYQKGGLQWGPYGRSADENMNHVGVSGEVLELTRTHGANITRVARALKGAAVFS